MAEPVDNPYRPPESTPGPSTVVVLVLTLLVGTAVIVALAYFLPGLAGVAAMVGLPAAIRMAVTLSRRTSHGGSLRVRPLVALLLGSMAIVVTAWIAATIAFVAVCLPVGLGSMGLELESLIFLAFGAGGLAGLAAGGWALWRLWPLPDQMAGTAAPEPANAEIVE